MKKFTTSKGEYVALPISKNASAFRIVEPIEDDTNQELYYIRGNDAAKVMIELSEGSWSFLCTTDDITEEVAASIVDRDNTLGNVRIVAYKNYPDDDFYNISAIDSFKSLLQSLNLSPDKTYAILQKELIPTEIASMSEVVAKYMNKSVYGVLETGSNPLKAYFKPNELEYAVKFGYKLQFGYSSNWNKIHEVWEKVREYMYDNDNINFILEHHRDLIGYSIIGNNPLEAFTALYNAITFINNLKQ